MAQTEDTELRDLVIEALEKNGSLAKIRALLRANIFLAFEDDCENIKQNESLDKILLLPAGKLCLSIIHDFLDFCNLRNTLFVYKSETRQGKEYSYEGRNTVADKLNLKQFDQQNQPVLLSLINNILHPCPKNVYKQDDKHSNTKQINRNKNMYKSDQDCTYIVHEDSSTTTSHTQSDNSSDEKHKLDLRLTLDNSDTDTSSESVRSKTRSEYIPNKHTLDSGRNDQNVAQTNQSLNNYVKDLKVLNNSSNESTSYVELKPFNKIDAILLNTTGLPVEERNETKHTLQNNSHSSISKVDTSSQVQTLNSISESIKKDLSHQDSKTSMKNSPGGSNKYDESTEYSYDFTSPPLSGRKDTPEKQSQSLKSIHEDTLNKSNNSSASSHKQNSISSQSSVSISDVADLISEKSSYKYSYNSPNQFKLSINDKSNRSPNRDQVKIVSDDSGDFSESPIPSLSNLSLDIHSD
ncbi:dentin sialophosphoprotein-like [Nymphalis io]|uniref:dentin sialophosphoprotein-like n=1 Tax=Inachis io TaxID=171585 RepID=UPI00216837BA|nr:dentin sialophosphoprotein-like [Nymphalis io]